MGGPAGAPGAVEGGAAEPIRGRARGLPAVPAVEGTGGCGHRDGRRGWDERFGSAKEGWKERSDDRGRPQNHPGPPPVTPGDGAAERRAVCLVRQGGKILDGTAPQDGQGALAARGMAGVGALAKKEDPGE